MIMTLKSKQIDHFATPRRVGQYIVARNDDFKLIDDNLKPILGYSMAMEEKSAAQVEEINKAIQSMKDDGTLDKLIKENITDLGGADPVATPLPMIDGAETLKVAVTARPPASTSLSSANSANALTKTLNSSALRRVLAVRR